MRNPGQPVTPGPHHPLTVTYAADSSHFVSSVEYSGVIPALEERPSVSRVFPPALRALDPTEDAAQRKLQFESTRGLALKRAGVPVDHVRELATGLDRSCRGNPEDRAELVREVMSDLSTVRKRATAERLRDEQP